MPRTRFARMLLPLVFVPAVWVAASPVAAGEVELEFDQAKAALAVVGKQAAGKEVTEADWERLFSSQGWLRLHDRQESVGQPLSEEMFKEFLVADGTAELYPSLKKTLNAWKRVDVEDAARLTRAYLPQGTSLACTIYPVIVPLPDSFSLVVGGGAGMLVSVDPDSTAERFANTVAHELLHVGIGRACKGSELREDLPLPVRMVVHWTAAFGEGTAMVAAAGGRDLHPHAASQAEDRERWDRDVAAFNQDLRDIDRFFVELVTVELTDRDEIRERGLGYYSDQGPWFTVGWKMAVVVEQARGREHLVASLCEPERLLIDYNEIARERNAAGEDLAVWSETVVNVLGNVNALR